MPQQPFTPITGARVKQFLPGQATAPGEFQPGDFILTHGSSFISRLIRFGQAIRFHGPDRKYIWWNHAAVVASKDGDLIEALNAGVIRTRISRYKETEYHLVQLEGSLADQHDRDQAVKFAERSLKQKYGYLTVISIALSLLTGAKFAFGYDGQSICSGLVARALERTNKIFDRTPSHIMPADLAKSFGVNPPDPGANKGKIPSARYFWERTEKRSERGISSNGASGWRILG